MKDFEDLYNELINKNESELSKLWEETKKEKIKRITLILVLIAIVDIAIIFVMSSQIHSVENTEFCIMVISPIIFCDVIIATIISILMRGKAVNYNSAYKENILEKLIKNFFDEVDYIPKKGMPAGIYDEGKYNEYYNRYYSDDYVDAKLDNKYDMKMAEVHTVYESTHTDSDGHTHTDRVTKFHGLFVKIKMDKSIKNNLIIKQDKSIRKKEKLEMDSTEFEKLFDVSSEDNIIGMQILTPDVMELLIDYRNYLKRPFDICIYQDTIYIRVHCGTMFEAKINSKTFVDKEKTEQYYNMLRFVYKLTKEVIKMSDGDF